MMGRQFTVKDFILLTTLVTLLVVLLLTMYMIDRQWEKMAQIQSLIMEQSKDIHSLRQSFDTKFSAAESRLSVSGTQTSTVVTPAFERAFSASTMQDFAKGDWLVNTVAASMNTITPLVSSDAYASIIQNHVLESLLIRDPDTLAWKGLIANDWEMSEDGLTLTFQLKKNVSFSDGHPLTADDIVFTFTFIMNEAIAAPRDRAILGKIARVYATNPYEVVFKFKAPYFNSLLIAGDLQILPRHFYEPFLDDPETFNQSKGLLLGSGAYRLANQEGWKPDTGFVELIRNTRYWGDVQPSFGRILWRTIENETARLTAFRNGEIDSYTARPAEYKQLLQDAQIKARCNHYEYLNPAAGYAYIGWNQKNNGTLTWFADKRVRQAMTYLTDRERMVNEIMLGYAEVATGPFNPASEQHNSSLKPRAFNPEKAIQLLESAGYEDRDGDGVIENLNGKPFEFEMLYFQDHQDTRRIVLLLKDLYARAGIRMIPKPLELPVLLELMQKKQLDAIILAWTGNLEHDIYQMFHSSQIKEDGDNFIHYQNEKLDDLIDSARSTVDEDERMLLWREAETLLYEDQPYTFLMRGKTMTFFDKRIKNLQMTRLGLNNTGRNFLIPVEWYVPDALQKYQE